MKTTISASSLSLVRAEAERRLGPDEFAAVADGPIGAEEREETLSRLRWYLRRYPTAGERLAYIRRATDRMTRPALVEPTALVTDAFVGPRGVRATPGAGVRVCLMNVLRWTPTDLDTRCSLLSRTIAEITTEQPTILLGPAGYFGWDTATIRGKALAPDALSRDAALRFLTENLLLPKGLLLVVGLDDAKDQHIVFVEAGRVQKIRRGHSDLTQRTYRFEAGGLRLLGLVCGEFSQLFPSASRSSELERDLRQHQIDAVLDPAHLEVPCSQEPGADLRRFSFERFFQDVSRAGAACFLAHHHPNETRGGRPKNRSYSNWGIFAGEGREEDWLPPSLPRVIRAP